MSLWWLLLLLVPAAAAVAAIVWFYRRYLRQTHVKLAPGVHAIIGGGGNSLLVEDGSTFNLFTDQGDPRDKQMLYRLFFTDGQGRQLTLSGHKSVHDDPGNDLYSDTTTLFTRVLAGHVQADQDGSAEVVAAGIIRIHLLDFLRQLTTFRTAGGSALEQAGALGRFGTLFLGSLWDVYAARVLSSGPV